MAVKPVIKTERTIDFSDALSYVQAASGDKDYYERMQDWLSDLLEFKNGTYVRLYFDCGSTKQQKDDLKLFRTTLGLRKSILLKISW